jgi:hypothetical protein
MTFTASFLLEDEMRVATFKLAEWRSGINLRANPNLYFDIAIDDTPETCHVSDRLILRLHCVVMAVCNIVNAMAQTVGYSPDMQIQTTLPR